MTSLNTILRPVVGLFIEDGALAAAIAIIVLLAGLLAAMSPEIPSLAGAVLLFGCLGVLALNVVSTARRDIVAGVGACARRRAALPSPKTS